MTDIDQRTRVYLDNISDGVLLSSIDGGQIFYVNPRLEEISGYDRERIMSLDYIDFFAKLNLEETVVKMVDVIDTANQYTEVVSITNKVSRQYRIEIVISPVETYSGIILYTLFKDTGYINQRLHAVLNTIDHCNSLLFKHLDLSELTRSICETIVEQGNESLAWLGIMDFDDLSSIKPVASAGPIEGLFEDIDSLEISNNNISAVLEYGEALVIQDINEEEGVSIWGMIAEELSLKSILLLPLQSEQITFGILSIFSDQNHAYMDEIVVHYQDMVAHLSLKIVEQLFDDQPSSIDKDVLRTVIHDINNLFNRIVAKNNLLLRNNNFDIVKDIDAEIIEFSDHLEMATTGHYEPFASQPPGEKIDIIEGSGPTILVVDDDHGSRKLLIEILKVDDYTIVVAASGEDALSIVGKLEENDMRVDLVITDIVMPGMGGFDLTEELRQLDSSMKFLFISGYQITPFVENRLDEMDSPFISKPFKPSGFRKEVADLLGK